MLGNQRPYQLLLSRTHCRPLALIGGAMAKFLGIVLVRAKMLAGRRATGLPDPEEAENRLLSIFPRPVNGPALGKSRICGNSCDVSIIIPAHNAETFMCECLESVVNQETDYSMQIIVVDDFSTDGTAEIVKEYSNRGVTYILFKDGGNAARARNRALEQASGEYVMFVDSDDILAPGAVQTLVGTARRRNADIVQGGWQYIDENGVRGLVQTYAECEYVKSRRADCLDLPGTPWAKIYRRSLFDKVSFPNAFSCFEDAVIHMIIFPLASRIVSIKPTVYIWRKNSSGLTSTSQNRPKAIQAYWITEHLHEVSRTAEGLDDSLSDRNLILQLSNFCYVCVSAMDDEIKKAVFSCCCNLYRKASHDGFSEKRLPFAIRLGQRALQTRDFKLWELQGRYYPLIR